jgi:uncharacterized protein
VLEINLHRLEPGRSRLELGESLSLGEGDDGSACTLHGSLVLDNMDQKVLVHGSFAVERGLECDRCGRDFVRTYEAEVEVLILRSPGRGGELPQGDDSWVIHQQGGIVSLAEPLREATVLHEPQQVLCREDCKGLCPRCGVDRNEDDCDCGPDPVDPRWEALKRLREDSSTGDSEEE